MKVPNHIKVFVYGHYDSRGGTVGVRAQDRADADRKYTEWFAQGDANFIPDGGIDHALCNEDFLYEAILYNGDRAEAHDDLHNGGIGAVFLWTTNYDLKETFDRYFKDGVWEAMSSGGVQLDDDGEPKWPERLPNEIRYSISLMKHGKNIRETRTFCSRDTQFGGVSYRTEVLRQYNELECSREGRWPEVACPGDHAWDLTGNRKTAALCFVPKGDFKPLGFAPPGFPSQGWWVPARWDDDAFGFVLV